MADRADHIAWIVAIIGVPLAVGAWLGAPNIWIPMVFMILAWLGSLAYIHVMHPSKHVWVQIIFDVASTILFGIVCWAYWSLFLVHIEIRMVDAMKNSAGGKNVRIEVELTNQGKATGLQKWRAELVDEHGTIYYGKPVTLVSDHIDMKDASGSISSYALPACDLYAETTRAVQPGDSVYGIGEFYFPQLNADRDSLMSSKIRLRAKDMLGRTISSDDIPLSQVATQTAEVFPCEAFRSPQPNSTPTIMGSSNINSDAKLHN